MESLSLEVAFEKWAPELTRYAAVVGRPDEAGDVVAETFHSLLQRAASLDAGWHGEADPRGYLFRCVLNTARMRARSEGRRRQRETRASTRTNAAQAVGTATDPKILAAVERLSHQQRAVVYLAYWDDMTTSQIADALDIGVGTVKRHLSRAKSNLRRVLS
jgi:RNA polymerase sigma-70 factor (ECF subfamily)